MRDGFILSWSSHLEVSPCSFHSPYQSAILRVDNQRKGMIEMAGPALKQLHSHRAIHEGGLSGAIGKTEMLIDFLQEGDQKNAERAANDLVDYWKTRVISHADAEEDGFYQEIVTENPTMEKSVTQLTRDHDLIRIIVADIEVLRETEGISPSVLQKFYALLVVNEIHSREEERLLFTESPSKDA